LENAEGEQICISSFQKIPAAKAWFNLGTPSLNQSVTWYATIDATKARQLKEASLR
jgi:hypothetical protein